MICFYHSADLDGHCSGAIVKRKYPDCEMYGIDYGDEFPWDKIVGQEVIMVDFCLQPFRIHMPKLLKATKSLIWIDHHQTEINEYFDWKSEPRPFREIREIKGLQNIQKAACELCWYYFFGSPQDNRLPIAIYLLARYDVWDLEVDQRILPFQWGMRLYENTYPESSIWGDILSNEKEPLEFIERTIERGELVLTYRDSENCKYIKAFSFETIFEGLRFICINRGMTNSQMFDSIWDEKRYDGMLTFCWQKEQWTVSMYTTHDIDLSEIAKKNGGGGHKKACGFQCDTTFLQKYILKKSA